MKKLFIIALIIGFASACTKSSIQYEQPGEISFRPVTAMTTKAAISGTTYPEDSTFNVWAWWGDVPENTSLSKFPSGAEMYLNKRPFGKDENGNSWVGLDVPYFWPTRGSLVFAGYSPVSAKAQNFSYSWSNKTMTITAYEQSIDISKTVDLMWFDVTERQVASLPGDISRGKRSSMPQPKTRPESPVPSLQGPCDRSLKSEVPCGSCLNWR